MKTKDFRVKITHVTVQGNQTKGTAGEDSDRVKRANLEESNVYNSREAKMELKRSYSVSTQTLWIQQMKGVLQPDIWQPSWSEARL